MTDILKVMNKSAKGVQNSSQPCDLIYGTVISTSPLKIQVDDKLTLSNKQLQLSRAVIDFEIEMSLNGVKELYTIHNALKNGEKVTMIRALGGQQYLVIDKEVV